MPASSVEKFKVAVVSATDDAEADERTGAVVSDTETVMLNR